MEESKPEKVRFIIEFDLENMNYTPKVEGKIPIPLLMNALEVEKHKVIMQQIGTALQQAAQQPRLLTPNGTPLPNFRGM